MKNFVFLFPLLAPVLLVSCIRVPEMSREQIEAARKKSNIRKQSGKAKTHGFEKNKGARMNELVLYHGSKTGIKGDVAPISRDKCDFGKGFYMGTEKLSQKYKNELLEKSAENREKGVSLAEEICRKHRRDGMFFDEILERAK